MITRGGPRINYQSEWRILLLVLLLVLSMSLTRTSSFRVITSYRRHGPVVVGAEVMATAAAVTASTFLAIGRSSGDDGEVDDNEDDNGGDDDDDDDPNMILPYRNRSLSWTLRYRRLNPYERARSRAIGHGHRSKDDWDDAVSSGQLGQYVPSHPDLMYATEWVSWDEWLGLMRKYDETRYLATCVLGLRSLEEYTAFVECDVKRAEGLRIPARPDSYYEDEWTDEEGFFGKNS
jgi:hypothetical protein